MSLRSCSRPTTRLILLFIVFGIGYALVSILTDSKLTEFYQCQVEIIAPGARIYVNEKLFGVDECNLVLTGDEDHSPKISKASDIADRIQDSLYPGSTILEAPPWSHISNLEFFERPFFFADPITLKTLDGEQKKIFIVIFKHRSHRAQIHFVAFEVQSTGSGVFRWIETHSSESNNKSWWVRRVLKQNLHLHIVSLKFARK